MKYALLRMVNIIWKCFKDTAIMAFSSILEGKTLLSHVDGEFVVDTHKGNTYKYQIP